MTENAMGPRCVEQYAVAEQLHTGAKDKTMIGPPIGPAMVTIWLLLPIQEGPMPRGKCPTCPPNSSAPGSMFSYGANMPRSGCWNLNGRRGCEVRLHVWATEPPTMGLIRHMCECSVYPFMLSWNDGISRLAPCAFQCYDVVMETDSSMWFCVW